MRLLRRQTPTPYSRGLRVRVVKPDDIRALVEGEPMDARRVPVLDWLESNRARIKSAYVIEWREPPARKRAITCSLLIIGRYGPAASARVEVGKAEFRRLRRCGSEDLRVIADHLSAASEPLNNRPYVYDAARYRLTRRAESEDHHA